MIKEIKFTDNALKQIGNLLSKKDKGSFFRIAIKGGGCSGFQYEFTFDQSKNDDDLNYENILIDNEIPCFKKGDFLSTAYNISAMTLPGGSVKLYIPESFKTKSETLLNNILPKNE